MPPLDFPSEDSLGLVSATSLWQVGVKVDSCLSKMYPTGKGYHSRRGHLFCVGWCLMAEVGVEELQSGTRWTSVVD